MVIRRKNRFGESRDIVHEKSKESEYNWRDGRMTMVIKVCIFGLLNLKIAAEI